MRPLDPLSSIKFKLGVLIVAAIGVGVIVQGLGLEAGLPLWAVAVVAIALGLAVVQILARGMTSPLREMVAAARTMARGDYSRRVRATSRDEVGELARAFNSMAAELEQTDRVRRDLVANVSHELRTPITALRAVLENMVDGVEPPEPATLRVVLAQVERLGRMVSQLLDLSRLESGVVPLARKRVQVAPLVAQVASESDVYARGLEKDLRVTTSVVPSLEIDADPERMHQVLANVLENAVRHTPDGSEVRVEAAAADDGTVVIAVTDEGPGIAPNETERVFERFYRSDGARSASDGGTGLGLAIARWIVELHDGSIRAESNRLKGCRIVIELPAGAE